LAYILVVDDEASIRDALKQLFEYEGHEVALASDGIEALAFLEESRPDLIFLDVKMPGLDGLEVLKRIRDRDSAALVVMISGHGTIDTAVDATRKGAYDFLEKPLDSDRLLLTLRNALELRGLSARVEALETEVESRHEIVGSSFAIRQVVERVERVAPTDARVLVTGENGTGKELVARAIHRLSHRVDHPFIEVNCAAIPSELIESELFGHIKGSFTGAVADRPGKFEQAHGGTLFLDEVGDMSLAAQAKVLRALEEGLITRVGGSKAVEVDVRVIAATNKDLPAAIEDGAFREDLYYRLNVVPIHVPPLRERRDDIPSLVQHFAALQGGGHYPVRPMQTGAVERLQTMDWPGNVRELRNTVERLLILAAGPEVTARDVDRRRPSPSSRTRRSGPSSSRSSASTTGMCQRRRGRWRCRARTSTRRSSATGWSGRTDSPSGSQKRPVLRGVEGRHGAIVPWRQSGGCIHGVHDIPLRVGVRKSQGVPHLMGGGQAHGVGVQEARGIERIPQHQDEVPHLHGHGAVCAATPLRLRAPQLGASQGVHPPDHDVRVPVATRTVDPDGERLVLPGEDAEGRRILELPRQAPRFHGRTRYPNPELPRRVAPPKDPGLVPLRETSAEIARVPAGFGTEHRRGGGRWGRSEVLRGLPGRVHVPAASRGVQEHRQEGGAARFGAESHSGFRTVGGRRGSGGIMPRSADRNNLAPTRGAQRRPQPRALRRALRPPPRMRPAPGSR
jgi:two-component system nitrogen regulation response regulator NtrX